MRRTNEETREEVRRTREKLLAEMRRGNAQLPAALNGHTHFRDICAAVLHKLPAIACHCLPKTTRISSVLCTRRNPETLRTEALIESSP